jgi:hypothetical protein
MIAGGSLYRLDPRSGRLERRLQLAAGDRIVAKPVLAGPHVAVLGESALYFTDRSALDGRRPSSSMFAVPLQGMAGDLQRIDMARLADRTIISFVFGRDGIDGPHRAWQRIVSVGPEGTVRTLAQRSLGRDHADALRFRSYWLSPALRAITHAVRKIGSGSAWIPPRAPVEVPRGIWIAAGLLSLAAAAGAAFLARRRRLGSSETAAWALATLAFGLPMLAAFCLVREKSALTA